MSAGFVAAILALVTFFLGIVALAGGKLLGMSGVDLVAVGLMLLSMAVLLFGVVGPLVFRKKG